MLYKVYYKKKYIFVFAILFLTLGGLMLVPLQWELDLAGSIILLVFFSIYFLITGLFFTSALFNHIDVYEDRFVCRRLFKTKTIYYESITRVKVFCGRNIAAHIYSDRKKEVSFLLDYEENGRKFANYLLAKVENFQGRKYL